MPSLCCSGSGWTKSGYLYYRRKTQGEYKPEEESVIVDVKISRKKPEPKEGAGDNNVEWEQRSPGIWIKRQKKIVPDAVSAFEILFGPDAVEVRNGWQIKEGSLDIGKIGLQPRITIRRGTPPKPVKPVVMLNKNHNLKIIQIAGKLSIFRRGHVTCTDKSL